MKIINNNEENFPVLWEQFINEHKFYDFSYSRACINYKKLRIKNCIDLSFLIVDKNMNVLNITPFIVHSKNEAKYDNAYNLIPVFSKKKYSSSLSNFFFENVFNLLDKFSIKVWFFEEKNFFYHHITSKPFYNNSNFYELTNRYEGYVDLTQSLPNIKKNIRKSYKSLINKGFKNYIFTYFDSKNFSDQIGEDYRLFHKKISGRVTRPLKTFHQMYKWIKEGKALLFCQKYQSKVMNYTYVTINKKSATYASSAATRENLDTPLSHSMLWYVIITCKELGVEVFDLGDISAQKNIFFNLNDKEANIAFFKKGFITYSQKVKSYVWFKNKKYFLDFLNTTLENIS